MKVFKFGGASINSVERIKNVSGILTAFTDQPLVVIISAMSNLSGQALEAGADYFFLKPLSFKDFDLV